MIGKLLKYELKSTYQTFFLLYAVMLLCTLVPILGETTGINFITYFGYTSLVIVPMVVWIVYLYITIQRYGKNLYGREGYLMFTLPIKPSKIIASKIITAFIWAVLTTIVCIVALAIFIWYNEMKYSQNFFWQQIFMLVMYDFGFTIINLALIISGVINFITTIYFSITAGNLGFITKGNGIISVGIFFIIGYIQNKITMLVPFDETLNHNSLMNFVQIKQDFYQFYAMLTALQIVFIIVLFLSISYLLSKKLHLR